MGRGPAHVSGESMNEAPADTWAREIRDFLLGRLTSTKRVDPIQTPTSHELSVPPIRRWWIFEGKRYPLIGGSLAQHFPEVLRAARRLDLTFNPRLRVSDRQDGEVDWGHTLARGVSCGRPEYVVRSSGIGLDEPERAALLGWATWIADEWSE